MYKSWTVPIVHPTRRLTAAAEGPAAMGHDLNFLGVHSIRKGAATYETPKKSRSCPIAAGPSAAAVSLRVGWTMGTVQDLYIHYECAGDQYCGRVLCGLDIMSHRFATAGPLFIANDASSVDSVNRVVSLLFNIPDSMARHKKLVENCAAAIVFHIFRDMFHLEHPFRSSVVFLVDFRDVIDLCKIVVPWDQHASNVVFSGIPPHVAILGTLAARDATDSRIVADIVSAMDDRQMGGVLSENRLTQLLRSELDNVVVRMSGQSTDQQTQRQDTPSFFHYNNGVFRRAPANRVIPIGTVHNVWVHWICRNVTDPNACVAPMKLFVTKDVSHLKRGRKYLSEMKWLMNLFETEAVARQIYSRERVSISETGYSTADALLIISTVFHTVVVRELGETHGHGRLWLLTWQRLYQLFRKHLANRASLSEID